jgi:Golgi apparatus protein 1
MKWTVLAACALALPLAASAQEKRETDAGYSATDVSRDQGQRTSWREVLERLSQSEMKDRLRAEIAAIEGACGLEIKRFCGDVTPGEGRLAFCVQAYDDQLSGGCVSALSRAADNIAGAVERIAEQCLSDIRSRCGDAERVGQCVMQNVASFSPRCRTVIAALREGGPDMSRLRGMPVFSADDANLGQVIDVVRGPDGKLQAIQVEVGRFLGLGNKVISIGADKIEALGDRIRAQMTAQDVRSMPEAQRR